MQNASDKGFTLVELLIVVVVIAITSALAVAGLLRAKAAANEASAVGSMRAINNAQEVYAASCAKGFYATSLPILGSAPAGSSPFISPDLATAVTVFKSGYDIAVAGGSDGHTAAEGGCNPLGVAGNISSSYYATAIPNGWSNGSRYFWTGAAGTIYVSPSGPIIHTQGRTQPPAPARPLESAP